MRHISFVFFLSAVKQNSTRLLLAATTGWRSQALKIRSLLHRRNVVEETVARKNKARILGIMVMAFAHSLSVRQAEVFARHSRLRKPFLAWFRRLKIKKLQIENMANVAWRLRSSCWEAVKGHVAEERKKRRRVDELWHMRTKEFLEEILAAWRRKAAQKAKLR